MPWSMPRNVELQACRMRLMIDRLGVDKASLVRADGGEVVATAFKRCLDCTTLDECLPWISAETESDRKEPPSFCPNSETFAALRQTGTQKHK